jgi:predicted permease
LKQTGGAGAPRSSVRSALVVLQYSLAVVLMVGTLLLGRSVWKLMNVELGFDPGGVLTARLWLPQPNQPKDGPYFRQEQRVQLFQKLLDRGSAIPGVEAFALTSFLPLDGRSPINGVEIEGKPSEASEALAALRIFVSERYFDVMRVPLVRGRVFEAGDDDRGPAVAVVSESFAERYFPGEDPLGKRVRSSGGFGAERPWRLIVGIVGDMRAEGLEARARPQLYYPLRQRSGLALALLARTDGSLPGLGETLQATVSAADPDLPLYAIRPMEEVVREGVGERRFATWLGGAFSFMALALAGIGVYGVTSYSVRRRRREIGIRLALGAQPSRLLRLVLREGMRLFVVGAAFGLFVSVFAAGFLRNLLFEVSVWDPTTYVLVAVVLSASAIAACSLPARRAARMDPSSSLRYE